MTIVRGPSLDPDYPGVGMTLQTEGDFGFFYLETLKRAVAKRFNVTPRFAGVRMERYGLLKQAGSIS